MKKVILKQPPYYTAKAMLGIPLIVFSLELINRHYYFIPLLVLIVLLMFGSYAYEFNENLNHKLNIKTFNTTVFRFKKNFINPEYISLFNQSFISSMSSGFMVFGQTKHKAFTIKLYNKSKREIVFKSKNKEDVLRLGKDLADLFKVELHNTLK